MNSDMTALAAWADFYVIVGSSAGALIGLQFVVITLIAEMPIPDLRLAGSAFATPTIVHFGVVLLLSGILSAPWHGIGIPAGLWGLLFIGIHNAWDAVTYHVFVVRRKQQETERRPG